MAADPWMTWPAMPWWSLLTMVLVMAAGLWMSARVLVKAGRSPWWALLLFAPLFYVVGIWVFAFTRWPRLDRVRVTPPSDYAGGWNVPERPDGREDGRR